MDRTKTLAILLALVAVHIVLAALYASSTPYRQAGILLTQRGPDGGPGRANDIGAPDERQHVNYVARLNRGEGIPVFDPKDPNLYETYQSHQPPAYYFISTAWSKLTGITNLEEADQGLRLRALNVILGSITVAGTFFLAWWAFRREEVALLATAIVALLPMNAALSGAVSNDPLLIALCTWTLALAVRGMTTGWTNKLAIGVGLLTATAILTKTTGVALLPILLLAAFANREFRPKPMQFALVLVPILLLVTPWWVRNLQLYGDPLAIGAFNQAFVGSPQASAFIQGLGASTYWLEMVAWWTARSFVGVFGYMDIWMTNTGTQSGQSTLYGVILVLMLVGFVGWLLRRKEEASVRSQSLLMSVFAFIVLALFLRFNAQYFQAQARYLFPALGAIASLVAYGYLHAGRRNLLALGAGLLVLLLVASNALALTRLPAEFAKRTGVVTPAP